MSEKKKLSAEETMKKLFDDHEDEREMRAIAAMSDEEVDRELRARGVAVPPLPFERARRRRPAIVTAWLVAAVVAVLLGATAVTLATRDEAPSPRPSGAPSPTLAPTPTDRMVATPPPRDASAD